MNTPGSRQPAPGTLLDGLHVLVTGGTGSLGQVLVRALLAGQYGKVERVTVFSRDEARQHAMRMRLMALGNATDEVIFRDSGSHLEFRIGDVRDPASVRAAPPLWSMAFATPKSITFGAGWPSNSATRTLLGFRSRWITPFWCACCTARQMSRKTPSLCSRESSFAAQ